MPSADRVTCVWVTSLAVTVTGSGIGLGLALLRGAPLRVSSVRLLPRLAPLASGRIAFRNIQHSTRTHTAFLLLLLSPYFPPAYPPPVHQVHPLALQIRVRAVVGDTQFASSIQRALVDARSRPGTTSGHPNQLSEIASPAESCTLTVRVNPSQSSISLHTVALRINRFALGQGQHREFGPAPSSSLSITS